MAIIRKKYPPFVFIHIPKNAGTSVSSILLKNGGEHYDKHIYGKHNSAQEVKASYDLYDNSFSFTFVRNPFARMVSYYYFFKNRVNILMNKGGGKNVSVDHFNNGFDHWLLTTELYLWYDDPQTSIPYQKRPQTSWINNSKNQPIANFVGKVENIDADFRTVCDKININSFKLSNKNKSNHDHYKKIYSQESRKFIEYYFKDDLETFNYTF